MIKTAKTLAIVVAVLVSLGIVMLASTSSVRGAIVFNDQYFFIKRQLAWLLLSIVVGWILYYTDYHWWQKLGVPLALFSLLLLILVIVPPFRKVINGSSRWLIIGPLRFQPSELAKLSIIIVLSLWLTKIGRKVLLLREGFVLPLVGLGITALLILLEPDFGTAVLILATGIAILFIAGTRIVYLTGIIGIGILGIVAMVLKDSVRLIRILAFLWPEKYPDATYHVTQSKFAFMAGKILGVGIGNSIQKHLYLPEAHTDFILAIIGEELGFIATFSVILLFVIILICGIAISNKAPDLFGRYVAFGITFMITIQAAINIGVVTGCFPTKGLPLPFISYGGSSLVSSFAAIAILMNIAKHAVNLDNDKHTKAIKDRFYNLSLIHI